jgi:hypothetical protein
MMRCLGVLVLLVAMLPAFTLTREAVDPADMKTVTAPTPVPASKTLAPLELLDTHVAQCKAEPRCGNEPARLPRPAPADTVDFAVVIPNMLITVVELRREMADDPGLIDAARLFLDRYPYDPRAPGIARLLAAAYVRQQQYAEALAVGKRWKIPVEGVPMLLQLEKKTGKTGNLVPSADTAPRYEGVNHLYVAIHYYLEFQQRYP